MASRAELKEQIGEMMENMAALMFDAKPMVRAGREQLFDTVGDLADRSGIAMPKLLSAKMNDMPNAGAMPGGRMMITDALFKALGTTPEAKPTEELKAVIGHEMGHLKNMGKEGTIPLALMYGAPIAAMVAYHGIRKLRKHGKEDGEALEIMNEAMDEAIAKGEKEVEDAPEAEKEEKSFMQKTRSAIATSAKYIAAGALGSFVGMVGIRQFKLNREYAADAHGANLTSPEAMVGALKKIHSAVEAATASKLQEASGIEMDGLAGKIASATDWLTKNVMSAHPSMDQRENRLMGR